MVCIEMLGALAEHNALERLGLAAWELSDDLDVTAVFGGDGQDKPLDALVEKLFESLSLEEGQVLGAAAINRRSFKLSHLAALVAAVGFEIDEDKQLDALDHLVRHGMLVEDNRQRGFYHVAYGKLARHARMRLSVEQYRAGHAHLAVVASQPEAIDLDELLFHAVRGHQDDLTLKFLPDQALRFNEPGDADAALSAYEAWIDVYTPAR